VASSPAGAGDRSAWGACGTSSASPSRIGPKASPTRTPASTRTVDPARRPPRIRGCPCGDRVLRPSSRGDHHALGLPVSVWARTHPEIVLPVPGTALHHGSRRGVRRGARRGELPDPAECSGGGRAWWGHAEGQRRSLRRSPVGCLSSSKRHQPNKKHSLPSSALAISRWPGDAMVAGVSENFSRRSNGRFREFRLALRAALEGIRSTVAGSSHCFASR